MKQRISARPGRPRLRLFLRQSVKVRLSVFVLRTVFEACVRIGLVGPCDSLWRPTPGGPGATAGQKAGPAVGPTAHLSVPAPRVRLSRALAGVSPLPRHVPTLLASARDTCAMADTRRGRARAAKRAPCSSIHVGALGKYTREVYMRRCCKRASSAGPYRIGTEGAIV